MKLILLFQNWIPLVVTPFVGVWIETIAGGYQAMGNSVTPFVGVWIETLVSGMGCLCSLVTPFVGVWIETLLEVKTTYVGYVSHPSWVCGLKL